jgi:3,4-dihydroxyphenylacetate 2,3-dioxygenase
LDPDGARLVCPGVVRGLRALGEEVARLRPDAIIVASAHWFTTFYHYVGGARRLAGVFTSAEAPDPARHVPYDYPGDPELARALVEAGACAHVSAMLTEEPTLPLDSGFVTPLRFLTPRADVPVVPISLCHLADLAEALRWGRAIGCTVRAGPKRVILTVTGDDRTMDLFAAGELAGLEGPVGEFSREAHVAASGRNAALLLGALGAGSRGRVLGYRPASGKDIAVVTLSPSRTARPLRPDAAGRAAPNGWSG